MKGCCLRWVVGEGTVAQIKEGMKEEWKVSLMKVTESAEALDSFHSSTWTPVLSQNVQVPGMVSKQWEPPRCAVQIEPIRQPEGMACKAKNWNKGEDWKVSLCCIILAALEFHT